MLLTIYHPEGAFHYRMGITEEEQQQLLRTAVTRPEWEAACLAAILCLNTMARGCELKGLTWGDIDLLSRALTIRKSKTTADERLYR